MTQIDEDAPAAAPRRVAVCGGGVIGLSVALRLARRGHDVTVFESAASVIGPAAGRTSPAAAGILPPVNLATATDPIERLRGLSDAALPTWCRWLHDHTGIDPGYRRCGGLYLAGDPGEAASLTAQAADWHEAQIDLQPWTADLVGKRFAALRPWLKTLRQRSPDHAVAWWAPAESQIRPPRLLAALAAAVSRLGTIRTGVRVEGVESIGNRVRVCHTEIREDFDAAVLCGGAAVGQIEPSLRLTRAIVPIRGQMLLMRLPPEDLLAHQTVIFNAGNRYVVCRGDCRVLVGSCEEEAGWDCSTTPAVLDQLQQFAVGIFPQLTAATVMDRWAGLRPMTFDGFPMIGPVPRQPGVFVAAGHHRSGIHLSLATATLITEMIERRPTSIDTAPFAIAKQQSD